MWTASHRSLSRRCLTILYIRIVMAGVDVISFSDLTVNDCWVVGPERFAVGPVGEEEFYEIRTEWSNKTITYMRRRCYDLVKLVNSLEKLFPEDGVSLSQSLIFNALQKIKEAEENSDIKTKLDEVEKLLRTIIKMPPQYSRCEAVLRFFKTSPLDYTLKAMFDQIQPFYQSLVTVADVRRANGFCLANTETVLFDAYLLENEAEPSPLHSLTCRSETEAQIWAGTRFQSEFEHSSQSMNPVLTIGVIENKEADYHPIKQVTPANLTYLHLHACETDILE